MRKAVLYRYREKSFNNSFHVNQKPLPDYNALEDPYLSGYFENPRLKRHLKQIGLIKAKTKSFSRPKTSNKLNNLSEITRLKLPALEDIPNNNSNSSNLQKKYNISVSKSKKRHLSSRIPRVDF